MAEIKQKRKGRKRILRILRRLFVNRNVKDRLFRVVFRDKKYQLQLYNAINGTNFQNKEDLIYVGRCYLSENEKRPVFHHRG